MLAQPQIAWGEGPSLRHPLGEGCVQAKRASQRKLLFLYGKREVCGGSDGWRSLVTIRPPPPLPSTGLHSWSLAAPAAVRTGWGLVPVLSWDPSGPLHNTGSWGPRRQDCDGLLGCPGPVPPLPLEPQAHREQAGRCGPLPHCAHPCPERKAGAPCGWHQRPGRWRWSRGRSPQTHMSITQLFNSDLYNVSSSLLIRGLKESQGPLNI